MCRSEIVEIRVAASTSCIYFFTSDLSGSLGGRVNCKQMWKYFTTGVLKGNSLVYWYVYTCTSTCPFFFHKKLNKDPHAQEFFMIVFVDRRLFLFAGPLVVQKSIVYSQSSMLQNGFSGIWRPLERPTSTSLEYSYTFIPYTYWYMIRPSIYVVWLY